MNKKVKKFWNKTWLFQGGKLGGAVLLAFVLLFTIKFIPAKINQKYPLVQIAENINY